MFLRLGFRFIALLAITTSTFGAQPVINNGGVVNAASYAFAGLPNSNIAQGSMFLVFGTGMGPGSLVKVNAFPIPKELGGTSVKITVNGTTVDGLMVYTLAGQIAAILPSATPVGKGTITVTYNGATSAPQPIEVVPSSFGAFARNQAGSGPGVITDANYRMFDFTSAARPGDPAILWGTGLGAVSFDDAQPPQAKDLTNIPAEVIVGGKTAKLYYRGRSGCCSALDQIVFYVPSGAEGCHVPVVVKINNVVSNTTTMPITSTANRVCSDTGGFSATDLQSLLAKGSFSIGSISLARSSMSIAGPPEMGNMETMVDSGGAEFARYTAAQFNTSLGMFGPSSMGACITYQYSGGQASLIDPIQPKMLDAGPFINVNGPMGMKQMTKQEDTYSATFGGRGMPSMSPPYLEPGSYLLDNAAGGADVKGFNLNLNLPQTLTWTNQGTITDIIRSQGVSLIWSGGDPSAIAEITGSSTTSGDNPVGMGFVCLAPVSAYQFTVPPEVLLALPPSTGDAGVPLGFLALGSATKPVKFTAPGLDLGYALSGVLSGKGVNYQ